MSSSTFNQHPTIRWLKVNTAELITIITDNNCTELSRLRWEDFSENWNWSMVVLETKVDFEVWSYVIIFRSMSQIHAMDNFIHLSFENNFYRYLKILDYLQIGQYAFFSCTSLPKTKNLQRCQHSIWAFWEYPYFYKMISGSKFRQICHVGNPKFLASRNNSYMLKTTNLWHPPLH